MKLKLTLREKAILERHRIFPSRVSPDSKWARLAQEQGVVFDEFNIGRVAIKGGELPIVIVPVAETEQESPLQ